MVMIWFFGICVVGILFWIIWAAIRPQEWSEAGVPLTATLTGLAAFSLPLLKEFDHAW